MLKKYVFLHNYNQLVRELPVWVAEDEDLTYSITLIPWVELCYKFAKMVSDKAAVGNTVQEMIKLYVDGKIDLSQAPETDTIEYKGFTISTARQYRGDFIRELPRSEYYNESTLLDNGPYSSAEIYYVLKGRKVLSREIVLNNRNRARRITQYTTTMKKEDVPMFMESTLVFLQYLIDRRGYESVYRILPKSDTGVHDPCLGEIGIKYEYNKLFYIQDLSSTCIKVSFPYKEVQVSEEAKRELLSKVS